MVLPVAFLIGTIFGVTVARRKKGNTLDRLHYGVSFGIVFLLLALILSILLQRLGAL